MSLKSTMMNVISLIYPIVFRKPYKDNQYTRKRDKVDSMSGRSSEAHGTLQIHVTTTRDNKTRVHRGGRRAGRQSSMVDDRLDETNLNRAVELPRLSGASGREKRRAAKATRYVCGAGSPGKLALTRGAGRRRRDARYLHCVLARGGGSARGPPAVCPSSRVVVAATDGRNHSREKRILSISILVCGSNANTSPSISFSWQVLQSTVLPMLNQSLAPAIFH